MRIGANGEGQGKMSIATKITTDKDTKMIVLENWEAEPVSLANVRVEKSSRKS
jgi:hypothetical protein